MGGSFGGYMANWVAGPHRPVQGDRHARQPVGLDQFGPTTDAAHYWAREMTAGDGAAENSPHRHVENIRTPMLVIHGDKDYRVPIGEGLRLWYELLSKSQLAADGRRDAAPVPVLPGREPLGAQPAARQGLVRVVEHFLAKNLLDKDTARAGRAGPRNSRPADTRGVVGVP